MDALLSRHEAEVLAAACSILAKVETAAASAANRVLGLAVAEPNAIELGRVAEAAKHARESVRSSLIVAKVYGESEEAGAVL